MTPDDKSTGANVNGDDQLVIVNGATTVAAPQLVGSYAGATFSVGSDGKGGTDMTFAGEASAPTTTMIMQAPSPHVMAAAMAGMDSDSGLSILRHDSTAVHPSMLTRPGRRPPSDTSLAGPNEAVELAQGMASTTPRPPGP